MSINTDEASAAWEWFAHQRFQTDLLLIKERATSARLSVVREIRRKFAALQGEPRTLRESLHYLWLERL